MKKLKSPWYGVIWIVVWTVALAWFLVSGMFDQRESIGLVIVWLVLVGTTAYLLVRHIRLMAKQEEFRALVSRNSPALNAPCPCGSGKKYKRCCGVSSGSMHSKDAPSL